MAANRARPRASSPRNSRVMRSGSGLSPGLLLLAEVVGGLLGLVDALVDLVVVLVAGLVLGHLGALVDPLIDLVAVLARGVLGFVHHAHESLLLVVGDGQRPGPVSSLPSPGPRLVSSSSMPVLALLSLSSQATPPNSIEVANRAAMNFRMLALLGGLQGGTSPPGDRRTASQKSPPPP